MKKHTRLKGKARRRCLKRNLKPKVEIMYEVRVAKVAKRLMDSIETKLHDAFYADAVFGGMPMRPVDHLEPEKFFIATEPISMAMFSGPRREVLILNRDVYNKLGLGRAAMCPIQLSVNQ